MLPWHRAWRGELKCILLTLARRDSRHDAAALYCVLQSTKLRFFKPKALPWCRNNFSTLTFCSYLFADT